MKHFRADDSLGFQVGKTSRKMMQLLTSRFKPFDITVEQWSVLCRLWEQDGITQKELAARAVKDQPTITRILDCLDRKGMVRREANVEDRRSFLIRITPEGAEMADKLIPIEVQTIKEIMNGLSQERIDAFRETLLQLENNADLAYHKENNQQELT